MSTWGHSGECRLTLFRLEGHFCLAQLMWCPDWLLSQGKYGVIAAHLLSVTANQAFCIQKMQKYLHLDSADQTTMKGSVRLLAPLICFIILQRRLANPNPVLIQLQSQTQFLFWTLPSFEALYVCVASRSFWLQARSVSGFWFSCWLWIQCAKCFLLPTATLKEETYLLLARHVDDA